MCEEGSAEEKRKSTVRRDMGEGGGGSCFRRETWPCEVVACPGGLMKGLWWRHSCQYNSRQTFLQMRCTRAIANGQMDGWTGSSSSNRELVVVVVVGGW